MHDPIMTDKEKLRVWKKDDKLLTEYWGLENEK